MEFINPSQSIKTQGENSVAAPAQPQVSDEIVLKIFSFLNALELCKIASVSQSWKMISEDDQLWKELTPRDFALDTDDKTVVSIAWKNIYRFNKQTLDSLRNNALFPSAKLELKDVHETQSLIFGGRTYFVFSYRDLKKITLCTVDPELGLISKDIYSSDKKLSWPEIVYLNLREKTNNQIHPFIACRESNTTILLIDPFECFDNIKFSAPEESNFSIRNYGFFEHSGKLYAWIFSHYVLDQDRTRGKRELWDVSNNQLLHSLPIDDFVRMGYLDTFSTKSGRPIIFLERKSSKEDQQSSIAWDPLLNQESNDPFLPVPSCHLSRPSAFTTDENGRQFILSLSSSIGNDEIVEIWDPTTWNPIAQISAWSTEGIQVHRGGEYITASHYHHLFVWKNSELIFMKEIKIGESFDCSEISIVSNAGKDFILVQGTLWKSINNDCEAMLIWNLEDTMLKDGIGDPFLLKNRRLLIAQSNHTICFIHRIATYARKGWIEIERDDLGLPIMNHQLVLLSPSPKVNSAMNAHFKTIARIALITALLLVVICGLKMVYPHLVNKRH
jgi:hypothetical protein